MGRLSINFEQACEIDCIYCERNQYLKEFNGHVKTYEEIILEIKKGIEENPGLRELFFLGGGEPTQLPEFIKVCEFAHDKGIRFSVETNSLKFSDEEYCRKLVGLGLQSVFLTFNSHQKEAYNMIAQKDCYQQALLALKNLEKHKVPITMLIVIMKQNLAHFYKIPFFVRKIFPGLSVNQFCFALARINSPASKFKHVSFRLSSHAGFIESAFRLFAKKDVPFGLTEGAGSFPFCIFPGLMKYNPYFINGSGEDDKMHIKTEKCKPCIYKDSCPGIAITYKEVYGDGELKPLLE